MSAKIFENPAKNLFRDLFNSKKFLQSFQSDLWDDGPVQALKAQVFLKREKKQKKNSIFLELKLFLPNKLVELLAIEILKL